MGQWFGDSKGGPDRIRTLERCIEETKSLIDITRKDPKVIYHKQATVEKEYTRDAYYQACQHYKDSQELSGLRHKLADIIESRVNATAFFKEADSKIAVLNLKQHYGWKDDKDINFNDTSGADLRKKLDDIDSD